MLSATNRPLPPRAPAAPPEATWSTVLKVGLPAGLVASAAMVGTITSIAEVAAQPTAVRGIDSSTWTPLTSIAGFAFGAEAFHGDFAPLPIAFGLAAIVAFSVLFGLAGVGLILVTQGTRCGVVGAMIQGVAYGLFLQVFFMCLIVNGIQDRLIVYESAPEWGWWVAHAAFGATLGAVASLQLESRRVAP